MSSNCPPQLHLELPPNTTSFKRSFDQFGFDLESPLGVSDGAGASGSDGNDRNKRARSASSFSDDDVSIGGSQSSTSTSGSSSMSDSSHEPTAGTHSALAATRPATTLGAPHLSLDLPRSSFESPRLRTPEMRDIDMTDYQLVEAEDEDEDEDEEPAAVPNASTAAVTSQADEAYRLSLERFNAFDTQISALRRSRSPGLPRSPTPPPVLPPLELLGEETQINTNTTSFLQPPARLSPPLPNSFYGFNLPRSQRPTSGTAGRVEARQEDPRRLPHESHTYNLSHTDDVWNRITQDVRSSGVGEHQLPWFHWPPSGELEAGNQDDEEPDVHQPVTVRPDSPVPAIGELRSPSPLFDDLDELQPSTSTRRVSDHTTPPTLPPIQDHDESWEDPLESLGMFSWNGTLRPDLPARTTQPPSLSRISIPRGLPAIRDLNEENRSTAGSSSSDTNAQTHTLPSPFAQDLAGWLDDDSAANWFVPSSREEPRSSQPSRGTTNPSNTPSGNNGANSSAVLDSYAASRLEALHGIGEALQGIGRVLQESEITLRPYLMDTSTTAENDDHASSTRSSLRGSSNTEARTSGWRSSAGPNTNSSRGEANQESRNSSAVPRWLRLSAPRLPSPLEDHMRPWLAEGHSPEESSSPAVEPSMSFDEFRDLYARYTPADQPRRASPSAEPAAVVQSAAANDNPVSPNEDDSSDMLASSWFGSADTNQSSGQPEPSGAAVSERHYPASSETRAQTSSRTTAFPWSATDESQDDVQGRPDRHAPAEYMLGTTGPLPAPFRHRPRPQGHSGNRSTDAGPFGVRPTTTASSSSASYVSTPSLLRLRSRPYVSQSSTHMHTHTHSHSLSSMRGDDPPSTLAENPSEARRRIARLNLIQMQRERAEALLTDTWIPPPRPSRNFESQPRPRRPSPPRVAFTQLVAEERERNRLRTLPIRLRRDALAGLSSDASSNLFDVAVDLDRGRSSRPNNPTTGATAERFTRPGVRLDHRRFGGSGPPASEPQSSDIDSQRRRDLLRDFASNRALSRQMNSSSDREPYRNYLPIPSLPSPELDGVFDFTASHSTGNRDFEQRPSNLFSERAPSAGAHRSPSPTSAHESGWRRNRSPTRLTQPVRPIRRDFNPDSFAPGPFRNTIQRFYEANRAREVRASGSQSQTQPQSRYTPPSIPPLPFEDDDPPSLYPPDRQEGTNAAQLQAFLVRYPPSLGETNSPTFPHDNTPSFGGASRWLYDDDTFGRWPRPPAPNPNNSNSSGASSQPSDLHNFLSRRPRMEASRLEDPDNLGRPTSSGDEDGFNHALEVLRHDGLSIPRSQELINRYHRERQREPRTFTTPASPWGIIEQGNEPSRRAAESTTNEPPLPRLRRAHRDPLSFETSEDETDYASSISNITAERARLLRARRFRRPNFELGPVFPNGVHEFIRMGGVRRSRALGDYMRDEDFDESYESLLSLAATLGEAKPRCTPDSVISGLETGLYKDWKTADSDHRCPICLDDYQPEDALLKLADCSHWLHRECLHQWLKSASTCPVCRKAVSGASGEGSSSARRGHRDPAHEAGPSRRRGNPRNGSAGGGNASNSDGFGGGGPGIGEWMPPWRYGQGS